MNHYVFVYGSLKRAYWNNAILKQCHAKYIGEGITIPDSFSMFDGSFPYVTLSGLSKISGEVYEVDEDCLRRLDNLEGVPSHYTRTMVDVKLYRDDDVRMPGEEDVVECIMYVASRRTQDFLTTRRMESRLSPDHNNILSWVPNK